MNPYIPSPTPFYGSFARTTPQRSNCRNHEKYKQYVRGIASTSIALHTMQIITETVPTVLTVVLEEVTGAQQWIITGTLTYLIGTDLSGNSVIVIPEQTVSLPGVEMEKYYRIIVDSTAGTAYSEEIYPVATWPSDSYCGVGMQAIKLTWSTDCPIYYGGKHDTAPFSMYLMASFSASAWSYEDNGEKGGDGETTATEQAIDKRWALELIAPEYVADALWHTALYKAITLEFADGETWVIKQPQPEVNWLPGNCHAKITYTFRTNNLRRLGCSQSCAE